MTFTVYHKQSILEAVFHSLINSSNMHTSNNQLCWHITTCKNKFCTHYTVVSMLGQCVHYDSIRLSDYRCPCSANGFCTIHSVPQHHWQHKFNEWWLTLSDSSAQSNSQTQTHMHRHRHLPREHCVEQNSQTPDITTLIITLLLQHLYIKQLMLLQHLHIKQLMLLAV